LCIRYRSNIDQLNFCRGGARGVARWATLGRASRGGVVTRRDERMQPMEEVFHLP
jgi:hypothetical protein